MSASFFVSALETVFLIYRRRSTLSFTTSWLDFDCLLVSGKELDEKKSCKLD